MRVLIIALLALLAGGAEMPTYPSAGSWRLRFSDTYTGYASDAAFEAAYDDPFLLAATSAFHVTWGLTNGPGAVPGILADNTGNIHTNGDPATGNFTKGMLALDGNEFRARGVFDNALEYGWLEWRWYKADGSDSEQILSIKAGKEVTGSDYGDLTVQVRTASGYGNITSTLFQEHLLGVVPSGVTHTWEIQTKFTTVAADGYARVLIDDVEVFLFNGPIQKGAATTLNAVHVRPGGKFTNLEVYDTAATVPGNDSTPCCGDTVDPSDGGSTPGDKLPEDPTVTLPPWTPDCEGGGTVPTAADIVDAEDWTDPALVPCVRAKLDVARDAGDVTLCMAKRPYPDFDNFTEPRVLSYGTIRRALSDDQGQPEMSTGSVTISINDADEPIRPALAENRSRFITTTEAAIEILSEAGRRAVETWRSLLRGRIEEPALTIQRNGTQRSRQAVLPIVDVWAPFYNRIVNDARFLRANFPNIDRALEGTPIPIIGGEHSDKGAVDVAGNNAEKGLVPGIYVGPWRTIDDNPLSSKPSVLPAPTGPVATLNGTPGSTILYYALTQRNARGETTLGPVVQVDTAPVTLNGTDSITLGTFGLADATAETIVYRGRYPTPSRRIKVLAAGVTTYTDTGVDPELPPGPPAINTAYVPFDEGEFDFWGLFVVGRGEIPISAVFASNVQAGVAPKRININETAGVDMLCPGMPGWLYPTNTLRIGDDDLTCILLRGPRMQQAVDGIVTVALDVCGMLGANGQPIQQAFPLLQHILTQFVPTDGDEPWRNGAWKPLREFELGTTTLKPTDFADCQDLSKMLLGNDEGYRGAIYLREPTPLRDLIQSFMQTFDCMWRVNHHGQGSPFLVNPFSDPATGSPYRERIEVLRLGDPILDQSNVLRHIAYQYRLGPGRWQVSKRGRDLPSAHAGSGSIAKHQRSRDGALPVVTRRGDGPQCEASPLSTPEGAALESAGLHEVQRVGRRTRRTGSDHPSGRARRRGVDESALLRRGARG